MRNLEEQQTWLHDNLSQGKSVARQSISSIVNWKPIIGDCHGNVDKLSLELPDEFEMVRGWLVDLVDEKCSDPCIYFHAHSVVLNIEKDELWDITPVLDGRPVLDFIVDDDLTQLGGRIYGLFPYLVGDLGIGFTATIKMSDLS